MVWDAWHFLTDTEKFRKNRIALKLFKALINTDATYRAARRHLEGSLDRLQTDWIDIYYLHRTGSVPLERVAEAMGRLMDDGLIRGWGLSQVDVPEIERVHRVTPLSAIYGF